MKMPNLPLRKHLFVLLAIAITAGCASTKQQSGPMAVPEIHPGILAGYLQPEELPNSLDLVPPPPAAGSAALALDEEGEPQKFGPARHAALGPGGQDAELMFPEAAGTFSCALGIPITESDTPHIYMLLRRTLADAGLSTYTAKNHYQRQRPFMVNNAPICTPEEEETLEKGRLLPFRAHGHRLGLGAYPYRDCTGPGGCHSGPRPGLRREPGGLQRPLAQRRGRRALHGRCRRGAPARRSCIPGRARGCHKRIGGRPVQRPCTVARLHGRDRRAGE
jgi:hypothetical protein